MFIAIWEPVLEQFQKDRKSNIGENSLAIGHSKAELRRRLTQEGYNFEEFKIFELPEKKHGGSSHR